MYLESLSAIGDGLTRISFRSTPMAVRGALETARTAWSSAGLGPDIRQNAEQVLAEVLNNVVEHAHADRPDGLVHIDTGRRGRGIVCTVRDDGVAMPGLNMPAGQPARIGEDLDTLPEGGFGWFMIRKMTRDLSYERQEGWNHLSFRICGDGENPSIS